MPPDRTAVATPAASAVHMTPIITTVGLKKTYPGGVAAVKGVDIEIMAGEIYGLLGPNGAGKSTTIGML